MMDAKPGESCRNDHFDNRFTCPNCYNDMEIDGCRWKAKIVTCHCGAILRCGVERIDSALCTIADPDEVD